MSVFRAPRAPARVRRRSALGFRPPGGDSVTSIGNPVGCRCLGLSAIVSRFKAPRARVLTVQLDLLSPSLFSSSDLLGRSPSAVQRCSSFSPSSSISQRATYSPLLRTLTPLPLLPTFASYDVSGFSMTEVPPGSANDSAPPPPAAPAAASVEKESPAPGDSKATKDGSKGVAGRTADTEGIRGMPGSQGQGGEAGASRVHTAEERALALKEAEAAVKAAAAKLAEVRDGPSTGLATPPKKQRLVLSVKEGIPAQSPPIPPGAFGAPSGARGSATAPPGDPSTDSDAITKGPPAEDDVIEVVEERGEGSAKVVASVPGPAVSVSQGMRSASPFQQPRRSRVAGRQRLRSVLPPVPAVPQVSLPGLVSGIGGQSRVALPGAVSGAGSPGTVALPSVSLTGPTAVVGTLYPVPDGFVDNEVLIEVGRPIVDVPVLDASELALEWPCRPRREVSLVQLEQLAGDGPIRADMSRLMKVRTCNESRAEAAVGIMMSHGRYLVPPALQCDRTFLHDPRDAGYVELASAMLFGRAGHGDIRELFPMAMLPAWWQFPLPSLPTLVNIAEVYGGP